MTPLARRVALRAVLLAPAAAAVAASLAGCAAQPAPAGQTPLPVVFFTEDSAALNDAALGVIREAAASAAANPQSAVYVLGFADPDGGRAFNRALSEARAQNVANQLRQEGVAPARIRVRARGPVPFEMFPLESRRVEIRIGE
ncbi:OmpA family protein [Roseomonas sp. NAR14]|uniref:OmpA family protein n=1 Tax=Roseomonas acroporae TaxID=2937791 RepID=A0A9X1Y486_9PROT|nr:OmpA family protein [Roseomonas acroporae]MCK8783261.1 OmpA family protein [Roseomonas acroporae]